MKCRTDSKEIYSFHFGNFSIVETHGQLEESVLVSVRVCRFLLYYSARGFQNMLGVILTFFRNDEKYQRTNEITSYLFDLLNPLKYQSFLSTQWL